MSEIKKRLQESAESCVKQYEAWDAKKSDLEKREELQEAITLLRENGCTQICMLKCTSAYPAKPEEANLITIKDMIIYLLAFKIMRN